MSYKMTDNDVCRVSRLDVTLGSWYFIAKHILKRQNKNKAWSQVTWETWKKIIAITFLPVTLLYPVLTEVIQALP